MAKGGLTPPVQTLMNTSFTEKQLLDANLSAKSSAYFEALDEILDKTATMEDAFELEANQRVAARIYHELVKILEQRKSLIPPKDHIVLEGELINRHLGCDLLEQRIDQMHLKRQDTQQHQLRLNATLNASMTTSSATSAPSSSPQTVRLPKLTLPSFNGVAQDFKSYWDRFKSAVDNNPTLSDVDKLQYLMSSLREGPLKLVSSFKLEASSYAEAKVLLELQYGNEQVAIESLMKALEGLKVVSKKDAAGLREQVSSVSAIVRSLKQVGVDLDAVKTVHLTKVVNKFPHSLGERYYRETAVALRTIAHFLDFITQEVAVQELLSQGSETSKKVFSGSDKSKSTGKDGIKYTVVNSAKAEKKKSVKPEKKDATVSCIFGDGEHKSAECRMSVDDKAKAVQEKKLCFNCLGVRHFASKCPSKFRCRTCNGKHHSFLHKEKEPAVQEEETIVQLVDTFAIFLMTFCTQVSSGGKRIPIRGFFDSGSQRTFVRKSFVEKVGLKPIGKVRMNISGFESRNIQNRCVYSLTMLTKVHEFSIEVEAVEANSLPNIPPLNDRGTLSLISELGVELSDKADNALPIDILVGQDFMWILMKLNSIAVTPRIRLQETAFGWVCGGMVDSGSSISYQTVVGNVNVEELWKLESIGIKDADEEDFIENKFRNSVTRLPTGRYEVELPFNSFVKQLKNNYQGSLMQLFSTIKKMKTDEKLQQRYLAAMQEYVDQGHAELVQDLKTDNVTYYIPHHPVIKEARTTTKFRVVFNASAPKNGTSLNSCTYIGPSLNPDILRVWIRFRFWLCVLLSDITKAFLQISVAPSHRDVLRYLWISPELFQHELTWQNFLKFLRVFRMRVVSFGLNCSPFLLCAVIRYHAENYKDEFPNEVADLQDTYMDDLASGENDEELAYEKACKLKRILDDAKLPLEKWETSSPRVREKLRHFGFSMRSPEDKIDPIKVLGVSWDPTQDQIFHPGKILINFEEKITKRQILGYYGQVFDPLGLWSPMMIELKIIIQDLCLEGLLWDDPVSDTVVARLKNWYEDFCLISSIRVPRWVGWKRNEPWTLEVCSDASNRAYGCTLHFKSASAQRLIFSKARLAPIKSLSIPRLELMAALVAVRCSNYLLKSLNEEMKPESVKFRTDSKVCLAWIKCQQHKWKPFVSNRVREILELSDSEQWSYIATQENPADLLTRPIKIKKIIDNQLWWSGSDSSISEEEIDISDIDSLEEVSCPLQAEEVDDLGLFNRYSRYKKLLRVVAYMLRWRNRSRGSLSADELGNAERTLVSLVQRKEFSEEIDRLQDGQSVSKGSRLIKFDPILRDGLVCIGGRLGKSILLEDQKHPILLPNYHPFTMLLIDAAHEKLMHGGTAEVLFHLRNHFWILRGRRAVQDRISKCLTCKKARLQAPDPKEAVLPDFRTQPAAPFRTSGMDHFGPFYTRQTKQKELVKVYGLIITCMVTRAIHLELCESLSVNDFLLAFRRFCATRGSPERILSDNSRTFDTGSKIFKKFSSLVLHHSTQGYLTDNKIKWEFISPLSPWKGGTWERLIRTVKEKLRRSLPKAILTSEELRTVFYEIASIVNSRPLCYVYDTPGCDFPLTPSHFLQGGLPFFRIREGEVDQKQLKQLFKNRKKYVDQFWGQWLKNYLQQLRTFIHRKPGDEESNVRVGEMVLLERRATTPFCWPLARVMEVFSDQDGVVRMVRIRLGSGEEYNRSVRHLRRLELH